MLINLTSHNSLLTANPGSLTCTWLYTDGGDVLKFMPHLHPDALMATQRCKGLPLCNGISAPLPGCVTYSVRESVSVPAVLAFTAAACSTTGLV